VNKKRGRPRKAKVTESSERSRKSRANALDRLREEGRRDPIAFLWKYDESEPGSDASAPPPGARWLVEPDPVSLDRIIDDVAKNHLKRKRRPSLRLPAALLRALLRLCVAK
jgi:hypothetical protein